MKKIIKLLFITGIIFTLNVNTVFVKENKKQSDVKWGIEEVIKYLIDTKYPKKNFKEVFRNTMKATSVRMR